MKIFEQVREKLTVMVTKSLDEAFRIDKDLQNRYEDSDIRLEITVRPFKSPLKSRVEWTLTTADFTIVRTTEIDKGLSIEKNAQTIIDKAAALYAEEIQYIETAGKETTEAMASDNKLCGFTVADAIVKLTAWFEVGEVFAERLMVKLDKHGMFPNHYGTFYRVIHVSGNTVKVQVMRILYYYNREGHYSENIQYFPTREFSKQELLAKLYLGKASDSYGSFAVPRR